MFKLLPKDKMPHGFGMELKESSRSRRKKVAIPEPKPNESPEFLAARERHFKQKIEVEAAKRKGPIDMNNLLGGNQS